MNRIPVYLAGVIVAFVVACGSMGTVRTDEQLSVSNVNSSVQSEDAAVITWKTNLKSTSQVVYGTDNQLNRSTQENSTLVKDHQVPLTGLSENTTYYYKVVSHDSSGTEKESEMKEFTTLAASTQGPVLSNIRVLSVTSSSAIIGWDTDQLSNSLIEYGKTTGYGSDVVDLDYYVLEHNMSLANLDPNQRYHFRVISTTKWNHSTTSDDYYFDTKDKGSLSLYPETVQGKVGDTISLVVQLTNISDLFALRFICNVNRNYLEFIDKVDSTLLTDTRYKKINCLREPRYDNSKVGFVSTWLIQFDGDKPLGTDVDIDSRAVALCVLKFKVMAAGETSLTFNTFELLDAAQNQIKIYEPAMIPVYLQ